VRYCDRNKGAEHSPRSKQKNNAICLGTVCVLPNTPTVFVRLQVWSVVSAIDMLDIPVHNLHDQKDYTNHDG
jgi:hypothetical protein